MNKEKNMKLNLNPYFKSTIETSSVVWSHDENSYQFNFDFTEYLCDKPFDLTDGKPRILLEFLNDKNAEVQIYPLIIDSEKLGIAHFIIPERVLGYVGDVKASLTIDFSNKSYDLGNFSFRMKKSPIDNKMPQLQFYVDEFEKAIEKADELNAQIKDRDLVTKPELAVVENKKADKTTVNDISLHLLDKADKTDVNAVKSEMDNKADKVAVDAKISELTTDISNTQIGLLGEFNSESELKEKYPNGTNGYAVVFENSVGYTYTYKNDVWTKGNVWNGMTIADNSIDSKKTKNIISAPVVLFTSLNSYANFITSTNTLQIPNGGIRLKNKNYSFSSHNVSASEALKTGSYITLFFNTNTLMFEFYSNTTIENANQDSVLIGVFNVPYRKFYGINFDVTYDNRISENVIFGNKQHFFITGLNSDIFFDWSNQKIIFPSETNAITNDSFFGMADLTSGKELVVDMVAGTANEQILVFNKSSKKIRCIAYNQIANSLEANDIPFAFFSKSFRKVVGSLNWTDKKEETKEESISNNNVMFLGLTGYIDFDFKNKVVIIPDVSNIIIGNTPIGASTITGRKELRVPMPTDPSKSEYLFVWDNKNNVFEFIAWADIKNGLTANKIAIAYTAIMYQSVTMINGEPFKKNGLLYDKKELEKIGVGEQTVIPDYFKNEIDRLYEDVVALKTTDNLVVSHITDIHGMFNHIDNFVEFNNRGLVDIAVNGGDTLNTEKAKDLAISDFNKYQKSFNRLKCQFYLSRGNHDAYTSEPYNSSTDGMDSLEFTNRMVYNYKQSKFNDKKNDGYYFVDDDFRKVRIIFTNSSNGKTDNFYRWDWDVTQLKWLAEVALNLDESKKDYHVLIFGHHNPLQKFSGSAVPKNADLLLRIINAFKNGESIADDANGINHNFEIKHEVIAYVFGHTHQDALDTSVGFPLISTASSLPDYYPTPTGEKGVNKSWERTKETKNEDCWDVFIINTKSKNVKIRRFGAGENREFNY